VTKLAGVFEAADALVDLNLWSIAKRTAAYRDQLARCCLGVQGVLLPGKRRRPTVSASYIYRLHASPAPEIDIGTFRQSAIVLVSDDLLGFHFDF